MDSFIWDKDRKSRTGVAEAVLCSHKSSQDLQSIIRFNIEHTNRVLFTRLSAQQWEILPAELQQQLDYDKCSLTAMLNVAATLAPSQEVCIVTAGTSDLAIAKEAQRTLAFNGYQAPIIADVGVAGLWRLMDRIEDIRQYKIIIALAGMEGALFSVLAGLVRAPIIAVPTSVGYGVSAGGELALNSALGSCSPGILTVNIDNGFGAANAAIKIINQFTTSP
ncbi:nickel pincer cofactor biosynthesis protein LarB [Paraglaciecola aquimarina]|uniref:Nickel pincer cofactor biosynthesis protein LarB n=1 Tax=Paraglaciecola aquimarina TaxID=1235557 RepID=A0ABU3SZD3_9ALTE|nr:nickel pincer cofactor biosynthesis protein LarB [Paraglaciecola aquimarina]MDU0355375.1 nickel pincer cofactor biosynthesis protein LarB [Paraglaciecola aquimarina]